VKGNKQMNAYDVQEAPEQQQILQYLTFTVKDETYGVDIMSVREIKGWSETTRLPGASSAMRGVINLRGAIIPIFDLRARFHMEDTEPAERNVVIIVSVEHKNIGILVDTVSDILSVDSTEIKPAPDAETSTDNRFLSGLITTEERMVILLDIERLFEQEVIDQAGSSL
jgi:purine-binding chemotaxis protein CheW